MASIAVIAGVGNATGTGAAVARAFASQLGYRVALIARKEADLMRLEKEINDSGGTAKGFQIPEYSHQTIAEVFKGITDLWPDGRVRVAVYNASQWSRIPFLEVKRDDLVKSANMNMISAFAFSQEAIKLMLKPTTDGSPKGGTLLLTGATSATRGAENFATFAAGKHALRAMSQSIAREFGKQDIHVCFVIVDGTIVTTKTRQMFTKERGEDVMNDPRKTLSPEAVAENYIWLHNQSPSAWTLELDLRPAHEKF